MLTVLPDASSLFGHMVRARGDSEWRRLIEMSRQGRVHLAVSEITLVELEARLRDKVLSLQAAFDRAKGGLRALGASLPEVHGVSAPDLAAARVREVRRDILGARGLVLAVPRMELLDLVRRAAARRRPFDANGNGFRDTLLWETAAEVARSRGDVLLVSADARAFAAGDLLHPELAQEASLRTGRRDSITLVADLAKACEMVEWEEALVERLRARLELDSDLQWDAFKTMVIAVQDHTLGSTELRGGNWPPIIAGTCLRAVIEPARVGVVSALPRSNESCLATLETRTLVAVDVRAEDLDDEVVALFPPDHLADVGQPLLSPHLQVTGELSLDIRWTVDIDMFAGTVGEARVVRVAVPAPPPAVGPRELEPKV